MCSTGEEGFSDFLLLDNEDSDEGGVKMRKKSKDHSKNKETSGKGGQAIKVEQEIDIVLCSDDDTMKGERNGGVKQQHHSRLLGDSQGGKTSSRLKGSNTGDLSDGGTESPTLGHFAVGEMVEARFGGRSRWFPGKVVSVDHKEEGYSYEIAYEDGDKEEGVMAIRVRRPGQKAAKAKPGMYADVKLARRGKGYHLATIGRVNEDGTLYVKFQDGDYEWSVPSRNVILGQVYSSPHFIDLSSGGNTPMRNGDKQERVSRAAGITEDQEAENEDVDRLGGLKNDGETQVCVSGMGDDVIAGGAEKGDQVEEGRAEESDQGSNCKVRSDVFSSEDCGGQARPSAPPSPTDDHHSSGEASASMASDKMAGRIPVQTTSLASTPATHPNEINWIAQAAASKAAQVPTIVQQTSNNVPWSATIDVPTIAKSVPIHTKTPTQEGGGGLGWIHNLAAASATSPPASSRSPRSFTPHVGIQVQGGVTHVPASTPSHLVANLTSGAVMPSHLQWEPAVAKTRKREELPPKEQGDLLSSISNKSDPHTMNHSEPSTCASNPENCGGHLSGTRIDSSVEAGPDPNRDLGGGVNAGSRGIALLGPHSAAAIEMSTDANMNKGVDRVNSKSKNYVPRNAHSTALPLHEQHYKQFKGSIKTCDEDHQKNLGKSGSIGASRAGGAMIEGSCSRDRLGAVEHSKQKPRDKGEKEERELTVWDNIRSSVQSRYAAEAFHLAEEVRNLKAGIRTCREQSMAKAKRRELELEEKYQKDLTAERIAAKVRTNQERMEWVKRAGAMQTELEGLRHQLSVERARKKNPLRSAEKQLCGKNDIACSGSKGRQQHYFKQSKLKDRQRCQASLNTVQSKSCRAHPYLQSSNPGTFKCQNPQQTFPSNGDCSPGSSLANFSSPCNGTGPGSGTEMPVPPHDLISVVATPGQVKNTQPPLPPPSNTTDLSQVSNSTSGVPSNLIQSSSNPALVSMIETLWAKLSKRDEEVLLLSQRLESLEGSLSPLLSPNLSSSYQERQGNSSDQQKWLVNLSGEALTHSSDYTSTTQREGRPGGEEREEEGTESVLRIKSMGARGRSCEPNMRRHESMVDDPPRVPRVGKEMVCSLEDTCEIEKERRETRARLESLRREVERVSLECRKRVEKAEASVVEAEYRARKEAYDYFSATMGVDEWARGRAMGRGQGQRQRWV